MGKARNKGWFRRRSPIPAALCGLALATFAAAAAPSRGDPADAARLNQQGLTDLAFDAFGRDEQGWAVYEPLIAREIGSARAGDTRDFASALAGWQGAHGLGHAGVVDRTTLTAMNAVWLGRRPFVAASQHACPTAPAEAGLVLVPPDQSYGGKSLRLLPAALLAYGRMRLAALAEGSSMRSDARLMTVFSAYRSPGADAVRCVLDGNCQGVTRASCSAHSTGLAIDVFLGSAPGHRPDSSDDVNRLYMSRGDTYRWMVTNAARFGFVPYPFEPWHWEWAGEPIAHNPR